jgi:hypothetical protein
MMARLAGAVLLLFGLLPIANWIGGGHVAPWYADRIDGWLSGGAIVLGIAAISGIALRRYPQLWRTGAWGGVARRWHRAGWLADGGIAAVACAVYAVVARAVLSAKPLLIDEIIQVYQARIFASGRLWLPAPEHPEFTGAMHLIDWGGKVYGQFPAGGPAMLTLGTLVGAEWLVGPVAAAVGVLAFARLLRRIEGREGTALAALLLYAFAPFVLFLSGSMMNHVTALMWILLGAWALATAIATARARPLAALAMGLALGLAATIRPLDGAVFAIPAGVWLLWRARKGWDHFAALLASGVGIALPLIVLALVNQAQTGDAFRFGYIEMWGRSHELGFHEAPWGFAHTPLRGLELVNLYLLRLQQHLFETPVPALLFASLALVLVKGTSAFDRWVLYGCGGVLVAYWAYWHDGYYLGPRFVLPLAPWLALWTARFPAVLAERTASLPFRHAVVIGGVSALIIGTTQLLPLRAEQYRNGMLSMRLDVDAAAAAQGVEPGATVLVRESWGAQVVARMWGLGVSRVAAEQSYRTTDLCRLDEAVAHVEAVGGGAVALQERIAPWRADSGQLVALSFSPDTTGRVLPGSRLTVGCTRRVMEDRAGFTLFTPLLLANGRNRYIRDLHGRDSLVITLDPASPLWMVTKPTDAGQGFRFHRVAIDSMQREWREGQTSTKPRDGGR